jgi:hypothetical protein
MGRVKNYMVIDPGQKIIWERHGQTYEGQVSYLDTDPHSMTGEAYNVVWIEPTTGVAKETTVYPSEVRLDKMISCKQMDRCTNMMKSEDLND